MQILKLSDVCKKVGIKKSTVYLWMNQGRFPKPIKLSEKSIGWISDEIEEWLQLRIRATRA